MSVDAIPVDGFDEAVYIYKTAHFLGIARSIRSDSFPDHIHSYVKSAPLRADEFAMIVEVLDFDFGMGKTAMHGTVYRCLKDGPQAVPDMAGIKKYCQENGMWQNMLATEAQVEETLAVQKRAEEATYGWGEGA